MSASSRLRYLPVAILFTFSVYANPIKVEVLQEFPEAVKVETVKQPNGALDKQENASTEHQNTEDSPVSIPIITSPNEEVNTAEHPEKTSQEASKIDEFIWPMTTAETLNMFILALLALFNYLLWRSTRDMWAETKKTANAARDSADAVIKQFSADHRPWIKVAPKAERSLSWKGGNGSMEIHYTLTNTGNVIATGLIINTKIIVDGHNQQFGIDELNKMIEGIKRANPSGDIGGIFPNDSFISGWGEQISGRKIEEFCNSTEMHNVTNPTPRFKVIGVVRYANPVHDKYHVTGFIYTLRKIQPSGPLGVWIGQGDYVPLENLGLFMESQGPNAVT